MAQVLPQVSKPLPIPINLQAVTQQVWQVAMGISTLGAPSKDKTIYTKFIATYVIQSRRQGGGKNMTPWLQTIV